MDDKEAVVGIGIQKSNGHLFPHTAQYLRTSWGLEIDQKDSRTGKDLTAATFPINANKGSLLSSAEVTNGTPFNATLLPSRIEDIIQDIAEGDLDIGIISSDALAEWEAANYEISKQKGIVVRDAGDAGSRLMIGVAQTYLSTQTGSGEDATWRNAVKQSYEQKTPIFTSFPKDLENFLSAQGLPIPPIKVRKGGIEARAKSRGSIVIADLTASGETMKRNGFKPMTQICESRLLVIARVPDENSPKRPLVDKLLGASQVRPGLAA